MLSSMLSLLRLAPFALLCCGLACCSTARGNRLPAAAEDVLRGASELEIFALDPMPLDEGSDTSGTLHGFPILGAARITDASLRDELVGLVLRGIRESDGSVAACFDPRHGLRAVHEGRTLELLICFECLQIHAHGEVATPSGGYEILLTAQSVEPAVTRIYEAAGLRIAGR